MYHYEAKSNACQKRQARVRGYNDVGFGGKCPSPTYPYNDACCGENYCCWEKCSLPNPPDEYLNGLYKGKWMYDTTKGYYHAVSHFEGSGKLSSMTLAICLDFSLFRI